MHRERPVLGIFPSAAFGIVRIPVCIGDGLRFSEQRSFRGKYQGINSRSVRSKVWLILEM
jgi:hypothetical protein